MFAVKADYFSEPSSRFGMEDSAIIPEYYSFAGESPLLSEEEEQALALRISSGDESAVTELVNSNLRLVISIASKYACRTMSLMDLIQEGNIGLIGAARRFRPAEGCRFSTYASWWIKQAILRAISNTGRAIRLPVYIENLYSLFKKEEEKFRTEYGRAPEIRELSRAIFPADKEKIRKRLSKKLGQIISPDDPELAIAIEKAEKKAESKLRELVMSASDPLSFELESPDGSKKLLDSIACKTYGLSLEDIDEINFLLSHLSEEEKNIVIWRYGLGDTCECTLEAVSRKLGISKERVRQKEKRAIEKMRSASMRLSPA